MFVHMNDIVAVCLTDRGIQVLKERNDELRRHVPSVGEWKGPALDTEGRYKTQLWVLMHEFGEHTNMGFEPCFGMNIEILSDEIHSGTGGMN